MISDLNLPQGEVSWCESPACQGGFGEGELLCSELFSCVCVSVCPWGFPKRVFQGVPYVWAVSKCSEHCCQRPLK